MYLINDWNFNFVLNISLTLGVVFNKSLTYLMFCKIHKLILHISDKYFI